MRHPGGRFRSHRDGFFDPFQCVRRTKATVLGGSRVGGARSELLLRIKILELNGIAGTGKSAACPVDEVLRLLDGRSAADDDIDDATVFSLQDDLEVILGVAYRGSAL